MFKCESICVSVSMKVKGMDVMIVGKYDIYLIFHLDSIVHCDSVSLL